MSDLPAKRARVASILDARGAERLVLTSHGALAWYLDGARTHTSLAGDPLFAVVVERDGETVLTTSNERDRLVAEELPAGVAVTAVDWNVPLPIPSDALRETDVAVELRAARASLLPLELRRFGMLGREAAEVATLVLRDADPLDRETDVAAALAAGLVGRGIDPLVLLVAGSSRLGHRHPLPTAAPIGDRAMVVLCARRHGLIANVTRWVRFSSPSAVESDTAARLLEVEAAFFAATVPGARLADVFAAGTSAYSAHGFTADEWRNHHQGGAAGYNGRDPRATAEVPDLVHQNQAFAFNPSAPGVKVEDTVVTSPAGILTLTIDPAWPTVEVHGRARPVELNRSENRSD